MELFLSKIVVTAQSTSDFFEVSLLQDGYYHPKLRSLITLKYEAYARLIFQMGESKDNWQFHLPP